MISLSLVLASCANSSADKADNEIADAVVDSAQIVTDTMALADTTIEEEVIETKEAPAPRTPAGDNLVPKNPEPEPVPDMIKHQSENQKKLDSIKAIKNKGKFK